MNCYYVEGQLSWAVVNAKNKREAYSEGVKKFGRGNVKLVRLATQVEMQLHGLVELLTVDDW